MGIVSANNWQFCHGRQVLCESLRRAQWPSALAVFILRSPEGWRREQFRHHREQRP